MKYSLASVSLAAVLCTGCASVAVTNDAVSNNTAMALGLDQSQFTISNRMDSGIKTTYRVTTNSGRNYNCYVTGTISVMGPAVSDAICSEMNGAAKSTEATGASCNALLKAAGKC